MQVKGRFIKFYEDGEGERKRLIGVFTDGRLFMEAVWFSKIKTIASIYKVNEEYVIFGRPSLYRGKYSIAHPEVERFDPTKPPCGLRGIYPLTEQLRKRGIGVRKFQEMVGKLFELPGMDRVADPLPREIVERYGLMPFPEAVREMHLPSDQEKLAGAMRRMKFEELFYVELQDAGLRVSENRRPFQRFLFQGTSV